MAIKKGRLSRWSQLKSKGGASADEDRIAEEDAALKRKSENASVDTGAQVYDELAITEGFPEKRHVRPAAPVMAPLAGYDDADSDFEAPPKEALAMLNGEIAHEPAGDLPSVQALTEDGGDELERELTPEEVETVATLPPMETLTADSDFAPFMSGKVPEFIRRKALRVLYQSHPILGFRDGLNEYDLDYNVIDTLIDATTQTSYKIGEGQEEALEKEDTEESEAAVDVDNEVEAEVDKSAEPTENDENSEREDEVELDLKPQSLRDVRKPDGQDSI